jgi:hypothetical protein
MSTKNTDDINVWLDKLVFKHEEGSDSDAWCCLRDDSVRQALRARIAAEREEAADRARFEQLVWVLLSCGGELEITKAALHESPKDYQITTKPDSRLSGGLVYSLEALAQPKSGDGATERTDHENV